jgi:glycosyltransferase involved in cell wall biosynthesis
MHVIIVNYNDFQRFETLEGLMRYYFPLIGWARGLAAAGVKVTVFQRYRENEVIFREGIPIHLVADSGPNKTPYQLPLPLHEQVVGLCRENISKGQRTIVHLNGLLYPVQVRLLGWQLPEGVPLLVQHHGSRPWARGVRRRVQRWGLARADGFLFTSADLAGEWLEAGVISDRGLVYEEMESSAVFEYEERPAARAKTGIRGLPVILWAGNLDRNKDPLTILAGFKMLLEDYPEARLYMAYRDDSLLGEVKMALYDDTVMAKAVTLLGAVAHEEMADYFNSTDLFVQGSSKEGSGLALLECLACGVIPVVTDIPAFRAITGGGEVGALWQVGDAAALAAGMKRVLERPLAIQSKAARNFFEAKWTFEVIGRRMAAIYERILDGEGPGD